MALQTNSTCELGTAKHTMSHVRALSVSNDMGKIRSTALRATAHVTTNRHARQ